MATGIKIADLFAAVSIPVDLASMRKAETQIQKFQRETQRHLDNLSPPTMKIASFSGAAKGAAKAVGGAVLGSALKYGKLGLLGFGAAAGAALKDAISFDEAITDLHVSSGRSIGDLGEFRKKILAMSTAMGVSKEQVLEGAQTYVTLTGDAKTAMASLETFSKVAKGQKTDMQDVATVAATMGDQFGLTADQFEKAFSILSAGAKAGSIEFSDMAGLMASLGANFAQFGGSKGTEGIATLGAAFQIAKKNFGSASEAATGLEALMGSLQQNAKKLKKEGKIDVFEADGKTLKPMMEIVDAISSKNFNGSQLFELLGRKEAVKTLDALTKNRDRLNEIKQASMNANDVQVDYYTRAESSSERLSKAWNTFKNRIAEALTPERVEKFVSFMEKLLVMIVKVGQWIDKWIIQTLKDLIETLKDIIGFVGKAASKIGAIGKAAIRHSPIGGLIGGGIGGGIGDDVKEVIERDQQERQARALAGKGFSGAVYRRQLEADAKKTGLTGAKARAQLAQMNTVINVQPGPGMDENKLAQKVRTAFEGFFTEKMREGMIGAAEE